MREIWTRSDLTERSRIFLLASVGELSVSEACEKLDLSRQRFYELEDRAIAGYLRELAPKPAGRPPKPRDPTEGLAREIDKLKKENGRLWLYIRVLQRLAGIRGDDEKKRRNASRAARRRGETRDR
ncbi:MAG: hypothetical protein K8T91_18415 [Planctomycetes bacterium]|nr:hypothetical protein [Planctomycetota bacterium]